MSGRRTTSKITEQLDANVFGERLRTVRLEKKMTIQKLADSIGVQRGFISQLESGDRLPSFTTLILLLRALDVSADALLGCYLGVPKLVMMQDDLLRMIETATPEQMNIITHIVKFELEYMKEDKS